MKQGTSSRSLMVSALGAAIVTVVPMVAVLWALAAPGSGEFSHVWGVMLPSYALNTLALMVIVGVLATLVGVTTAWLVTATDFPGRRLFSWLLVLPLAAPAYIVAYLYTDLLEFSGPVQTALRSAFQLGPGDYWFPQIRSLPGAAIVLSLVLYPYIYLLARSAFAAQSRSQLLAARTLGLSPGRAFYQVVLPGARPAIAGGLALVLMETLADFGVVEYFGVPTFSTGIFRTWFAMGDQLTAMKLAGGMLLFVFVLVAAESFTRRGHVASDDRLSLSPPFTLSAGASFAAILVCSVPVILGFVLPITVLFWLTLVQGDGLSIQTVMSFAQNSVLLAIVTAALATGLAVLLAYADRQTMGPSWRRTATKSAIRIATLGYALPGALLAVGLLGPLGSVDRAFARFLNQSLGLDVGLLLTGTIALLVYALLVRFLTVSFNSVSGGMAKIPLSMDAAARSLGATPRRVVQQVHVPLLGPSLAAGAALVFIDVMRELPATLILRPFNFETLATRVYRLASDERLAEASTSALIIVLIGILPVILLNRVRN